MAKQKRFYHHKMFGENPSNPGRPPKDVVMKNWPACDYINDKYIDWSISGIDNNINSAVGTMKKYRSKVMY